VLGKRDLHHETREGIDLLFKPVFGRICSREAKTKFRNVIGQRKNSPRNGWISSYGFYLSLRANKFPQWKTSF
jgi:hypothetical protein